MLDSIWQSAVDYFSTHFYITPFWFWVFWGAVATFVAVVMGWAFPFMRALSGAVIMAVVAGLSGYRRAQYDDARRQEEIEARKQQPPWRW